MKLMPYGSKTHAKFVAKVGPKLQEPRREVLVPYGSTQCGALATKVGKSNPAKRFGPYGNPDQLSLAAKVSKVSGKFHQSTGARAGARRVVRLKAGEA